MSFLDQIAQILGQNPAAANMLTQALQGGGQQPAAQPAFLTNGMQNALARTPTNQIAGPIPNSPPPSAFAGDPKQFQQLLGQPAPQTASGMSDFVDSALKGFGAPAAEAPEVLPEIDVQQSPVPIPPVRPSDMGGEVKTQPRHANAEANKRVGNAFDALLPVPVPPVRPADMGGDNLAAAVPASSTTTVASSPAAAAATRSGILPDATREWLHSAFTGLATGRNWNEGLRNAGAMVAQTGSTGNVNQTRQAAVRMGMDPETAKSLDGKTLANFVIQRQQAQLKGDEPTAEIKEFEYAKKNGFTGNFTEYKTLKARDNPDEAYGTPVYVQDEQGNVHVGQLTKGGAFKLSSGQDGYAVAPGTTAVGTGTGTRILNSKTGQDIRNVPIDIRGKESEEKIGASQGEASTKIPGAQATAERINQSVDALLSDPGLTRITGSVMGRLPSYGPDAVRAQSRLDQIKGQSFLSAYDSLRGAGAITEDEGRRATEAQARLNQAQSEEDFRSALGELKDVARRGVERLKTMAGQTPTAASGQPKVRIWNPAKGDFD